MTTANAGYLEPSVQQALERGKKTLEHVLAGLRPRDVGSLQRTTNEAGFLLEAARLAIAAGGLKGEPTERAFHEAHLRGLARVAELRRMAEPCLETGAVGELLGVSRETVRKKIDRKQLLALPKGNEDRVFPAFQFQGGEVLAGIAEVLAALNTDPFVALSFLLSQNRSWGNISALEALRAGRIAEVLAEAGSFLEHGS